MHPTNLILFDDLSAKDLLPFTFTRPTADIRIGILTIREKWEMVYDRTSSSITSDYLSRKYPLQVEAENLLINGCLLPDESLIAEIAELELNEWLVAGDRVLAGRIDQAQVAALVPGKFPGSLKRKESGASPLLITQLWHIFQHNGTAMQEDYKRITAGRSSETLGSSNVLIGGDTGENLFIEEGASIEGATINISGGPVYIGRDAQVMEGSLIRGPFALCDHSTLKLGAKIYGPTTIGPHSKVGGEVNNSVIFGYSNKGHDGFLGNSVLGEWCNIGADSNNSNLKNNYAEVRLWNYDQQKFIPTGLQFCGLIMGDHSKCGINTMFNTGTVVGVSANIFGAGFPRNFIPSFSWGGAAGFSDYKFEKAMEVAERVMERRNIVLDETEQDILQAVYTQTAVNRKW